MTLIADGLVAPTSSIGTVITENRQLKLLKIPNEGK